MPIFKISETFTSANIITLNIETNYPQGGDAGHGGFIRFNLIDEAGTAMYVEGEEKKEITIELRGDTEFETFLASLKFAVDALEKITGIKAGAGITKG